MLCLYSTGVLEAELGNLQKIKVTVCMVEWKEPATEGSISLSVDKLYTESHEQPSLVLLDIKLNKMRFRWMLELSKFVVDAPGFCADFRANRTASLQGIRIEPISDSVCKLWWRGGVDKVESGALVPLEQIQAFVRGVENICAKGEELEKAFGPIMKLTRGAE